MLCYQQSCHNHDFVTFCLFIYYFFESVRSTTVWSVRWYKENIKKRRFPWQTPPFRCNCFCIQRAFPFFRFIPHHPLSSLLSMHDTSVRVFVFCIECAFFAFEGLTGSCKIFPFVHYHVSLFVFL